MTYVEDICLALIRVLEHAVFHRDVRLAGYAANAQFWAGEIRHAIDCLAGYQLRFAKMKDARTAAANEKKRELDPAWITPSLTEAELARLDSRLRASATAFMRACVPYLERAEVEAIEILLGLRILERRLGEMRRRDA